jgi:transcriptional regulator with XRE-family HTH domain
MLSAKVDAARLQEIREERGLSTTQLAALLSQELGRTVHQSTVSKYETGARQPRPDMFNAMCRALDVQRDELLLPAKANA